MDDELVGLDHDMLKIKDQLTGYSSKLEIIPIVGMGGIGKTTLARRVYEEPLIRYHFYIRAWIKVSQEYQERGVLLSILQSFAFHKHKDWLAISTEMLAEWVYRSLKCNRYLIVIDDIWDIETWDKMKKWFPNDNNRSRIIMTTREGQVAKYANPTSPPHSMNLLNDQQSWGLLLKKVFVSETCPRELLDRGWRIARKCQGLPLAIIVTAGHLSKISKTPKSWESFAQKVGSLVIGTQKENLDIFSLSYNNLPQHLKACLLYMGNFPKSKEIPVVTLLWLWRALRIHNEEPPINSLEEMGGKCLDDLINRNLIQVMSKKYDGTIKTCGLHDLLWDFIFIEAHKEGNSIFSDAYCTDSYFHSNYVTRKHLLDDIQKSGFKLLKFLHLAKSVFYFPDEITELINLRYLALASCGNIPGSVSNLRNLETLINHGKCAGPILPKEIWKMPRLMNLHVGICTYLPNPSKANLLGEYCSEFLPNLKTLSTICSTSFTKEVVLNIPSLKELSIHEIGDDHQLFNCLSHLVYLHKLEKLKLCCYVKHEQPRQVPEWSTFVPKIKHLTLSGSHLPWQEMNSLAALPNLEVLKLKRHAFRGPVWEQVYEGFTRLQFLLLESLELERWKANTTHFPNLKRLTVRSCSSLLEIPYGIAEIGTLQLIELVRCGRSAVSRAKKIQKNCRDMGIDDLYIHIEEIQEEQESTGSQEEQESTGSQEDVSDWHFSPNFQEDVSDDYFPYF